MKIRKFLMGFFVSFSMFLINIPHSLAWEKGGASTPMCDIQLSSIALTLAPWAFLFFFSLSVFVLVISGVARLIIKTNRKKIRLAKTVTGYAIISLISCLIGYVTSVLLGSIQPHC